MNLQHCAPTMASGAPIASDMDGPQHQDAPGQQPSEVYHIVLQSDLESGHQDPSAVAGDGTAYIELQVEPPGDDEAKAQVMEVAQDGQAVRLIASKASAASAARDEGAQLELLSANEIVTAVSIEEEAEQGGEAEGVTQQYILQAPENFHMDLLQDMSELSSDWLLDFPVFCRDGIVWVNKMLIAAASPFIRTLLANLLSEGHEQSCLIIPELNRSEVMMFHRALFAREDDFNFDRYTLVMVSEVLGCQLSLSTTPLPNDEPLPTVDYQILHSSERNEVLCRMGLGGNAAGFVAHKAFSTSKTSSTHARVEQLSNLFRREVPCDECDRSFINKQGLLKHKQLLHESGRSAFKHKMINEAYNCPHCSQSFNFAINLRKHLWLSHSKKPSPPYSHIAHPSNIATSELADLAANESQESRDAVPTSKAIRLREKSEDMTCGLCGLKATTWKQLQMHVMDHTDERPFKCESCGKGFKEMQKLRRHRVTHTGEKNHKCSFCGKGFGLKHNMKQHEKIHMGQGHSCSYCGKIFSQGTNMRDHESQHIARKHVVSNDPDVQARQAFVKTKGRPSIREMDQKARVKSNAGAHKKEDEA